MLGGVQASREIFKRIVRVDRHNGLDDHRPGVNFGHDVVNHAAAITDLLALIGGVGAFEGGKAGKRARQGGVQIDHPTGEVIQKGAAEDMHPTGQHDQIRPVCANLGGKRGIVGFTSAGALIGLERKVERGDAGLPGATSTTSASSSRRAVLSIIACKLLPVPETRTTSRANDTYAALPAITTPV
jgi:hypothetical protein